MKERNFLREVGKDSELKNWYALNRHMFMFVHSGSGGIVCQEKTYPLKRGILYFVGAGKFHYTMPSLPEEYDRSKVYMAPETFDRFFGMILDKSIMHKFSREAFVYAEINEEDISVVEQIFDDIQKYEDNELYSELSIAAGWLKLLRFADEYSAPVAGSVSGVVNRAIEYINNNIFFDINIDGICDTMHVSKYYFCRQFKKYTGMTVMNYILNTRIVIAKHMLTDPKVPVTEVSEKCGFSSVSYFSGAFKKSTGFTPTEFRKNYMLYPVL